MDANVDVHLFYLLHAVCFILQFNYTTFNYLFVLILSSLWQESIKSSFSKLFAFMSIPFLIAHHHSFGKLNLRTIQHFIHCIFTARVRSTREGNVLTHVCPSINLSVHRGGYPYPIMLCNISQNAMRQRGGGTRVR